jgi:hypothetical protein
MQARTRTSRHRSASGAGRGHTEERLAALERLLAAQEAKGVTQQEEMEHLREQVAAQSDEIKRLRAERVERAAPAPASPLILPAKLRGRGTVADDAAPERANGRHTSRRGLLKLGGVAAAAGLAAGAGGLLRPGAAHAAAARPEGSPFYNSVNGVGQTAIFGQGFTGANGTLGYTDNGYGIWGNASLSDGVGVFGTAPAGTQAQPSVAVKGDTTNNAGTGFGYGLWGISNGGWGVIGAANPGSGVLGDTVSGGGPGDGVHGAAGTGNGVVGLSNSGLGVYGHSNSDTGVVGNGHIHGVVGNSDAGAGGAFSGGRVPLYLQPAGSAGAPGGFHVAGDVYLDSTATLWLCTHDGTPGTWVRMAAVPNGTLGGAVNLLPAAIRLLDTRGGSPVAYHGTAQFQAAGVGAIPAGAIAVLGHVAAGPRVGVSCGDGSSARLWPAGQPMPAAVHVVYNDPVNTLGQCLTGTLTLVAIGAGGAINLYSQPINPVGVDYLFDAFGFVM